MSFVSLCLHVSPFVCLHSFICFLALVGVSAFLDFCLLVFPFICLAGLVTVFTSLRPSFLLCPFASSFHGWGVGVWAFGHFVSHFGSPWSGFWCQSSLDPSWDGVTKFAVCSHSFVSPIIFLALGLLGWENCLLLVTCFSVSLCDSLVVLCLPTLPLSSCRVSFVPLSSIVTLCLPTVALSASLSQRLAAGQCMLRLLVFLLFCCQCYAVALAIVTSAHIMLFILLLPLLLLPLLLLPLLLTTCYYNILLTPYILLTIYHLPPTTYYVLRTTY